MENLNNIVDLIKNKNLDQALKLCDLIESNKNKDVIFNYRGVISLLKNNFDLAESNFINSIKYNEKFEDPIKNLCTLFLKTKKFKDFLFYSQKLRDLDHLNIKYNFQLAFAFELNDNFNEALKYYKICTNFDDQSKKKAFNNIGNIYLKKKKLKEALRFFLQSAEINEDVININNILKCYIELRDQNKTKIYYDKAEKIDAKNIEFLFNKAKYFILKYKIDNAIKILEENKDNSKFQITLIRLLFIIGKNNEAEKIISQLKDQHKDNPFFYNFYSLRLLSNGNFNEGWKYYERRNEKKIEYFNEIKEWSGEIIENKNIVVFNEQGLGDGIQFSKYLIPLCKIAKHVTFVVQSNLKNLFNEEIKNLSIDVIENCKHQKYDFKITLGSIIKFFYTEKINGNLIKQNMDSNSEWKNKLSKTKLNVGLVWSGSFNGANEPYRSIPLSLLSKILSLNANFYYLQKEIWESDYKDLISSNLTNFGKYKLDEISPIIKNLDLVITVDTSLLHLSASLNTETWALICLNPDWRWNEFNKINPYKNLKIFRQKKFNNWEDNLNDIYKKLKEKINLKSKI